MKLINSSSVAHAWVGAATHLLTLDKWQDTTVVLHIDNPTSVSAGEAGVRQRIDALLGEHGCYSTHTVAETIFPASDYVREGAEGVYETYVHKTYPRLKRLRSIRWGTYAHRLLHREGRDGQAYNPLKRCIQKMQDTRPLSAAYEVDLGFELATYDDRTDGSARIGGPCLSHLSFKLIDGRVHLAALYRLHYYVERGFGNLLGLARLQAFVAQQVGARVGPLVCHSTLARLDTGKTKKDGSRRAWGKVGVRDLVHDCGRLLGEEALDGAA